MKSYRSKTTNGGKTVILDSVEEAIEIGRGYFVDLRARYEDVPADAELTIRTIGRDGPPVLKKETLGQYKSSIERFVSAVGETDPPAVEIETSN